MPASFKKSSKLTFTCLSFKNLINEITEAKHGHGIHTLVGTSQVIKRTEMFELGGQLVSWAVSWAAKGPQYKLKGMITFCIFLYV